MGRLQIEKMEGGTIAFRSRWDEGIDWAKSGCSIHELGADYNANIGKVVFREGYTPISFNIRWPSRKDFSIARKLGGINVETVENSETGEKENKFVTQDGREELGQDYITMELAVEVARVCTESVSDWDEWPAESGQMVLGQTHEKGPAGVPIVMKEAIPEQVLEDIGIYLITGSQMSDAEKKGSA